MNQLRWNQTSSSFDTEDPVNRGPADLTEKARSLAATPSQVPSEAPPCFGRSCRSWSTIPQCATHILELTRAAYDPSQPTSSSRPPSTDEHSPVDKSTAAENVERSIDHKSQQPSSFSTIPLHFHSSFQPPLQRHTGAFRPCTVPTPQYGISICSESDGLWRL